MLSASIDFGTSNSVAMLNINGNITSIKLGKDALFSPTVLFFSFENKSFYVGDEAIDRLEDGELGRYFVSLKSFLGANAIL